jgi:hypothetical protein
MSWMKFSMLLCTGVLLVGLGAATARADDPPAPPRDRGDNWDNGPATSGPGAARRGPAARRPQPPRGDEGGAPDARPEAREPGGAGPESPDRGPRRPPRPGAGERDRPFPPEGPGGPEYGPPPPGGPMGDRPRPREDFESMKTRDPELYKAIQQDHELERQTHDLAEQYRQDSKDERVKIKEKLSEIVGKHFEVRQQLRTLEVKRLEQQVKQLHERIEQREKNRKEIIEKRLNELIGDDDREHF